MFKSLSFVSKSATKRMFLCVIILLCQIIYIPYIVIVLYTLYWCDHFPYPYGFAILYGSMEINDMIWYGSCESLIQPYENTVNCKRKSRCRFFLLMRSRTPPISSEFRGGGVWTPQTTPSVRHCLQQPSAVSYPEPDQSILYQFTSVLILPSYLSLCLPSRFFSGHFATKPVYAFSLSPVIVTCPTPHIPLHLIAAIIFGYEYRQTV